LTELFEKYKGGLFWDTVYTPQTSWYTKTRQYTSETWRYTQSHNTPHPHNTSWIS